MAEGVHYIRNPNVDLVRSATIAQEILPVEGFLEARRTILRWPGYAVTPLVSLQSLAESLDLAALWVKDESQRFGLESFKALGGAYAVSRLASRADVEPRSLTVTCATDGNHGRSVAWGAARVGCKCVVYLHDGVSEGRAHAIRKLGAEAVRAGATYDESVRLNAAAAERNGWSIIGDTSPHGELGHATVVMQGYRVLAEEVRCQLPAAPTHVFAQVGCGGFAAALCAHLLAPSSTPPRLVAVEPEGAACLALSIRSGCPVEADGELRTIMAGLAVGQVSIPAWRILHYGIHGVIVLPDAAAATGMRTLAHNDPPITSGESGAAGMGGLIAAAEAIGLRDEMELDQSSRVLLVNTEGATDRAVYERIVGQIAE